MSDVSPTSVPPQADETVYCAVHPDVETALRCSRCEKPICPRCLVQTPVGARCSDCGREPKSVAYEVRPLLFARMTALAVGGGIPLGLLWAFASPGRSLIGFFSLLIAAGVGWLAAKGMERAAEYRRGTAVRWFAVAAILIAYVVRSVFVYDGLFLDFYGLIALAVASFVAIQTLK
ncbi:MAG: hypothetical protein GEU28_14900 [Dehalococcoidia bacterium]|nr:hypothetical protein [Dehalococcoidia bacterium]